MITQQITTLWMTSLPIAVVLMLCWTKMGNMVEIHVLYRDMGKKFFEYQN